MRSATGKTKFDELLNRLGDAIEEATYFDDIEAAAKNLLGDELGAWFGDFFLNLTSSMAGEICEILETQRDIPPDELKRKISDRLFFIAGQMAISVREGRL